MISQGRLSCFASPSPNVPAETWLLHSNAAEADSDINAWLWHAIAEVTRPSRPIQHGIRSQRQRSDEDNPVRREHSGKPEAQGTYARCYGCASASGTSGSFRECHARCAALGARGQALRRLEMFQLRCVSVSVAVYVSSISIKHLPSEERAHETIHTPMAWLECDKPLIVDVAFMACRQGGPCKRAIDEFTRSIGVPGHMDFAPAHRGKSTEPVAASCAKCHQLKKVQKCGRCHLIRYCGTDCQTEDYERHKEVCKTV